MDSLYHVRKLIEEVFVTCRSDDTGVTFDLLDVAWNAAQEIGMSRDDIKAIVGEEE